MIIQTQNSTYVVEFLAFPGTMKRWVADKFPKTSTPDVRKYARAFAFQGDTLTLGIGASMILAKGGVNVLETSSVMDIEP
mgnify:CR=1 FL=1